MKASSLGLLFLCSGRALCTKLSGSNKSMLNWGRCPDKYDWPSSITCAELVVPLDWNNPLGPKITLTMNKIPAKSPEKRIGSLIMNPGGPGGSAMEYAFSSVTKAGERLSDELLEHFDLIGPDPRGIGFSTPMRCNPDLWNKRVPQILRNESEFNHLMDYWKEVGDDCKKRTGPAFDYFDTISVARDLEAIRVALGEGPLNYYGSSYGPQLGTQYLDLFPSNVRAFVIDAMTDKTVNETNFSAQEMQSFETVVDHFISWAEKNESSPLKGRNVGNFLDKLFTRADINPIKAPGCRQDNSTSNPCHSDVTGEEMKARLQFVISYPQQYPVAAEALLQADRGKATLLSAEWYTQDTHADFSQQGAACADFSSSSTWPEWQNRFNLLKSYSPHLQGITWALSVQTICQNWPSTLKNSPREFRISGVSAPVLMVHALYDPQCPYTWGVNQQRGVEGSVLLTRDGDGHTSYVHYGDTQRAMDAYLINITMPEPGIVLTS